MAVLTYTKNKLRPLVTSVTRKGKMGATAELGNLVHKVADGDWEPAQADSAANATGLLGVLVSGARGEETVVVGEEVDVVVWGPVAGFTNLDETKVYYVDASAAGKIADAAPAVARAVGLAENAEIFFVAPETAASS